MSNLSKISIFLLYVSLVLFSCKKESTELPASLKTIIENSKSCICNPYIKQYLWKGQITYVSSCGGPACFCTAIFYDSEGKVISFSEGYNYAKFQEDATFVKTVWSCD